MITSPRTQGTLSAQLGVPVLAASRWAATAQARDQVEIAILSTAEVRTDIAVATAQTYLAIIAQKRQVEVSLRARETSLAHLDYARRRLEAGAGTRLNELRAGQEVSTNEARLENAQLGVRRAQEALGVLIAANGPADAAVASQFSIFLPVRSNEAGWMAFGPTCGSSSRRNARPIACGATVPKTGFPPPSRRSIRRRWYRRAFSARTRSWRFVVNFSQPVFDGGLRRGQRRFREANFNASRLALQGLQIQARSEVRLAQETVRSTQRAFESLRSAAQQAAEVLKITTFAFEAGATTNLEVDRRAASGARCGFSGRGGGTCGATSAARSAHRAGTVPAVDFLSSQRKVAKTQRSLL